MIEYDESEHLYTDVTDITLQFIFDMYGPDIRDKLLVPKVVEDVRPIYRYHEHHI